MPIKRFGVLPAIAITLLSVGLIDHVLIVPILLEDAKRDAWIAVLVALLIAIPWVLIPLFKVMQRMQHKRLDDWLSERLPPAFVQIIIGVLLVLLLSIGCETLVVTSIWTGTTYLPNTPGVVIIAMLVCLSIYAASRGLRTIAYVSCILLPIVILLGDFVLSANMPHKDYRYLLPLLEHGVTPVFTGAQSCLTAFSELSVLLMFQHHLNNTFKRSYLLLLLLFLALLAISPIIGAISEFGPDEAERLRFPAFTQWRLVSVGRYFEHVDFFAIYQWLAGAFVRMAFSLYLIVEYSPIRRMKHKWIGLVVIGICMAAQAIYFTNHTILYKEVINISFKYTGSIFILLVMLFFCTSYLKKRRVEV